MKTPRISDDDPLWMQRASRPPRGLAFRIWLTGTLFLAAVIAGAWTWMSTHGLPSWIQTRIESAMHRQGLLFKADHYFFRTSIVAEQCTWQITCESDSPVFRAELISLEPDWAEMWDGTLKLKAAHVRGGVLRLNPAGADILRDLDGYVELNNAGIQVRSLEGTLSGLRVQLSGHLLMPSLAAGTSPLESPGQTAQLAYWNELLSRVQETDFPEFGASSSLQAKFLIVPDFPERSQITVTGSGTGLQWCGMTAESWSLAAENHGRDWNLTRAHFRLGGGEELDATAFIRPKESTLDAEVHGVFDPARAAALPLPGRALEWIDRLDLNSGSPVGFSLELKQAAWSNLFAAARGSLMVTNTPVLGVMIRSGSFYLRHDRSRILVETHDARIGQSPPEGSISGKAFFDLETKSFGFDGEASAIPQHVMPLLNPGQSLYAGSVVCREEPVHFIGSARGKLNDVHELKIRGKVTARNASYHGRILRQASALITVTNQVLVMNPLHAEREEGFLDGVLTQDFHNARIAFDLTSTMSPYAVACFAGPAPHRFAQLFLFNGPVRVAARGYVDYRHLQENDVQAEVEGERIGFRQFIADQAKGHIRLLGREVNISGAEGTMCGGTFSGRATITLPDETHPRPAYHVTGSVARMDFPTALRTWAGYARNDPLGGDLDAEFDVSGLIGKGCGPSVTGTGHMAIANGDLMRVPVLGPLSRFLDAIVPGVGIMKQTEFETDFTLSESRVHTPNVKLLGSLLSMEARGDFAYDGQLRYAVEAKLLRSGVIASAVRLITMPVTKLFEFDLSGRMNDPHWEPRNLPRSLFLKFGKPAAADDSPSSPP